MAAARLKTIHTCTECGGQTPKWQGQCPHCSAWNTLVETAIEGGTLKGAVNRFASLGGTSDVVALGDVDAQEFPRIPTLIAEFDRVLGGGLVEGGVVLIGGDPGIGKSTLLLQAAARLAEAAPVLYVSGEESAQQVALRARRLGVNAAKVRLLPEIELEKIQETLRSSKPRIAVIDSIQTLYSSALTSAPGSVAQVRECAAQLTRQAKQSGITIIFVGHVTKEGALAGPRVLEHMVDTVLYFEGETHTSFRLIRAFKNRFGCGERDRRVRDDREGPARGDQSLRRSSSRSTTPGVAGSCVMVTQEGTRPLLVELQALVGRIPRHDAQAPHRRPRAESPRDAARGAASPRRHRLLRPGHLRERRGRRAHHGARARPRGAPRDRLEPAQQAPAREARRVRRGGARRARCARCSAGRSASRKRRSSASRTRWSPGRTSPSSPSRGFRSSRWSGSWRRWTA
jgi:DNA repair protein RadA